MPFLHSPEFTASHRAALVQDYNPLVCSELISHPGFSSNPSCFVVRLLKVPFSTPKLVESILYLFPALLLAWLSEAEQAMSVLGSFLPFPCPLSLMTRMETCKLHCRTSLAAGFWGDSVNAGNERKIHSSFPFLLLITHGFSGGGVAPAF